MKLWILRPVEISDGNPWDPWYDKSFGFIVRAETEAEARQTATKEAGDETRSTPSAWLDAKFSTCEELTPEGDAGIVMRDFASA